MTQTMSPARRSGQEVLKSRGGNAEWSAPSQSWGHTCPAVLLGTAAPDLNLALGPEGMCICTELRSNTQHLLDTREGAHYAAILVSATGLAASTCQFSATHPLQGEMKAAHCSACSRAFLPQRFAETRNGSAPEHDGSKCGHPRPMLQHPWFHRIEGWSAATGRGSRTSPSDTEPSCLWPPDMGWPYRPRKKWVDLEFVCRWTFNCSESISVWCWVCRL